MRKFSKLLIPALLIVAIVASCLLIFASAAETEVVYVSSKVTGGSGDSADDPIGNAADFVAGTNGHDKKSALYLAADKIKNTGGIIVLVDEVVVDTAGSRNGFKQSPSEYNWPSMKGPVTITSSYDGIDYAATKGAKLVLDHATVSAAANFAFKGAATTFENIHIEYLYNPDKMSGWGTPFMIGGNGYGLTIGENVSVTSWNAKTNAAGDKYPMVLGGSRFSSVSGRNVTLTVNSGTWSYAVANTWGMAPQGSTEFGQTKGNAVLTINGGTIEKVLLDGSSQRPYSYVSGDVTVSITGGKINSIDGVLGKGIGGELNIDIKAPAEVGTIVPGTAPAAAKNLTYEKGTVDFITNEGFDKVEPPFDPNAEKVIYVSSNGKGNGKTPKNPIGNGEGYRIGEDDKDGDQNDRKNALYRAADALKSTGGVIVIVGDVYLDTASSRNPSDGKAKTPSEMDWPSIKGNITITSTYDGVDYAAQNGAKLILDYATSHSTNVAFTSKTTFENLNIVYKYKSNFQNSWNTTFMLCANGYELVIGKNVNVSSFDVTKNKEGDRYPTIVGGHRFNNISRSPVVTINSGTWETVIGGSYGMVPSTNKDTGKVTTYGEVKGNATLTINGGKIGNVYGTGSERNSYNTVTGTVTINVNGGSVDRLYFANTYVYSGTGSVVTLGKDAKINFADYAIKGYAGDLDDLKSRVEFKNNNGIEIGKEPVVPQPVIYISAEGKGDGSTPESPLGHDKNYLSNVEKLYELLDKYGNFDKLSKNGTKDEIDFVSKLREGHVFYRAFEELANKNDGIIVLVDDVVIDIVSSRMPNKEGQANSPAEFLVPAAKGMVTVTSLYNGKNYGGKLILDLDKCNTTFLEFSSDVTFENIEMVHKYDPNDLNGWGTSFGFVAGGHTMVMGEGIVVTSLDADTNKEGDMYPIIVGGHRYNKKAKSDLTVKSGTWDMVIAGSFGNSATSPANIDGNAKLVIDGGKIGTVYGTGSQTKATGTVTKAVTITVNGGEIDRLYFSNAIEYLGTGSVVTLGKDAKINFADYAVKTYAGNLADLKSRVQFIDNNDVVIGKEPPVIPNVIYVASNGTGDGSSPENPLGNGPDYKENLQKMYDLLKSVGGYNNIKKLTQEEQDFIGRLYKDNVLYRAFEKANKKDTVIVLVGDIAVDIVSSRMTYRTGEKQSPAEFTLPKSEYNVTITSVYGGQDYRNQAKFILDLAACNTTNLTFQSSTVIENINIEHRYNNDDKNGWSTPFVLAANCNKFVIGENVNVTSFDTSVNAEGTWYPAILGGHRYNNKTGNADVTIKSGSWSFVNAGSFGMSGTYGKITGNATLNIEGGKIEAVYGTSSLAKPTASITKKLTINITGGFVEALYVTAKNGADNEIVVNIAATAERVAKAWGGTSDANIPANATINYDRSVTRDDEVKYWTTVNYTGNVEDQPEPYVFTLYVANVAKGKGDGSSPENAMGHAPDYAQLRKKALAIIKANGGTNSGLNADQKAITNAVYYKNAFYRALTYSGNKIVNQGGKIVVCGTLTIDSTDCMRKSLADFWTPSGAETITITSYDGTTNFRAKGAKLVLDTSEVGLCVEFDFPVTFDNLTIEHKYNSKNGKGLGNSAMIAGRGNKITVGYNVKVVATDVNPDEEARVDMYPTIVGGHRYSDSKSDNYVIVSSGQWAAVVGGDWGSAHTGNATIGINGGKIGTVCGTTNPTNGNAKHIFNGSVWIGLWGGEVDNVYVVGKPGMIWGDASIGLGGTDVKGKVRATHPDYEGDEIQSWVFNYTDKQVDTKKVVGFENPVPATGSALPYLAVVATVSFVGAAALIVSKKKKAVKN